ncbi:hypothetical protein RM533_07090 [Croceicoccus sp. F390]|uniref:Cupin 2 conserved barrel domain-containing protein n=1 Tax=Croceicoccus esteveae TaxID=3075597 RepID=A0ABU2ZH67_9SPHN|nr:hypothetical protein [Croceicoccus sp. F390]MDT0575948.1 hypothetical protein [Croceicoccus sp. F390]
MSKVHVQDGAANVWTPIRSVVPPQMHERMTAGEMAGEFKSHDRNDPERLDLLEIFYPANAVINVHAHEEDEIIYVVEGDIRLGKRLYPKGSSVFIARQTLYSFEAGPDGLHMVNFRARADHSFITQSEYLARKREDKGATTNTAAD